MAKDSRSDIELGYEGSIQNSGHIPGLTNYYWNFLTLRLLDKREITIGNMQFNMELNSACGGVTGTPERFAEGAVTPAIKLEFPRSSHRFEISGASSYDSTGLERKSLAEQWENIGLTLADKQRYRYFSAASDHYFAITSKLNLLADWRASFLGRGLNLFDAFFAEMNLEYEIDPRWRLRFGGSGQRFVYGTSDISTLGPQVGFTYQITPQTGIEGRSGIAKLNNIAGESAAITANLAIHQDYSGYSARVGWQRGIGTQISTVALSYSDLIAADLHAHLGGDHEIDVHVEGRHENWIRLDLNNHPADSVAAELRYTLGQSLEKSNAMAHSGFSLTTALAMERLQITTGQLAERQSLRLSIIRHL